MRAPSSAEGCCAQSAVETIARHSRIFGRATLQEGFAMSAGPYTSETFASSGIGGMLAAQAE